MKNLFFVLVFMLMGAFAFANNSVKSEFSDKMLDYVVGQDCHEYALKATDQEVGWLENLVTQGKPTLILIIIG